MHNVEVAYCGQLDTLRNAVNVIQAPEFSIRNSSIHDSFNTAINVLNSPGTIFGNVIYKTIQSSVVLRTTSNVNIINNLAIGTIVPKGEDFK